MALVNDWFPGFYGRLQLRLEYPWPEAGDAFDVNYNLWKKAAIRSGSTEPVADEASERLAMERAKWGELIARFVELVGEIFRESEVAARPADASADRKTAEAASKGCVECSGSGFTHRYRHATVRTGLGLDKAGAYLVFYCNLCPMGRWIKSSHRQGKERVDMSDLADFPKLHLRECGSGHLDNPHCHRPGGWDYALDRTTPVDLGSWRNHVRGAITPLPPPITPKALPRFVEPDPNTPHLGQARAKELLAKRPEPVATPCNDDGPDDPIPS